MKMKYSEAALLVEKLITTAPSIPHDLVPSLTSLLEHLKAGAYDEANQAQFVALSNIVNANFDALKSYLDK